MRGRIGSLRISVAQRLWQAGDFPRKQRLIDAVLPKHGSYLTKLGECRAVLDYDDPFERAWALSHDVARALCRHLKPGDCLCDCGAHVGMVSLYVAGRLGDGGQVYAFEPSPPTFERLRSNLVLSAGHPCQLDAFPVPLGAKKGKSEVLVSSQHGWTTLCRSAVRFYEEKGAHVIDELELETETLDSFFLHEEGRRLPTALKIDVEGFEFDVLLGGRELLANHPPRVIVVEQWSPQLLVALDRDPNAVHDLLYGFGYEELEAISARDRLYRLR